MRQFVTWRFWLTIAVLVALPVGLWVVVRDEAGAEPSTVVEVDPSALPEDGRRIDLILPVYGEGLPATLADNGPPPQILSQVF